MDLLLSLLGMAAMRLPVLIALAVSLVWAMTRALRNRATPVA